MTATYQVLYRTRPAWEVGSGGPDCRPGEHYPGDYAGQVISAVKIGHAWGPGDLKDPARVLLTLELTDEEAALLRSGKRKMTAGRPAEVGFDDTYGAIADDLRAKGMLDLAGLPDGDEQREVFDLEVSRLSKTLPPVIHHAAEKEA